MQLFIDFSLTGLPCKHFFAVFKHYPKWQWESFPEKYRENPYLTLDTTHVFADSSTQKEYGDSTEDADTNLHVPQTGAALLQEQQRNPAAKTEHKEGREVLIRKEAMACREILKGLTSLTYHVEDLKALQDLKSSLTTLTNKFSTFQTIDEKENMALTNSANQPTVKTLQVGITTFHCQCSLRKSDLQKDLEHWLR